MFVSHRHRSLPFTLPKAKLPLCPLPRSASRPLRLRARSHARHRCIQLDRPDGLLMGAHLAGDTGAFGALIGRHREDLSRFVGRLTGNPHDADDVLQDTFLQLHISSPAFDPSRPLKPWLFTIAANKGRDLLRRKSRRHTVNFSAPALPIAQAATNAPDARLVAVERAEWVRRALDRLPLPHKEVLILAYFQGLTYAQMADDLGVPLGTLKSRLSRAVAAMEGELAREHDLASAMG